MTDEIREQPRAPNGQFRSMTDSVSAAEKIVLEHPLKGVGAAVGTGLIAALIANRAQTETASRPGVSADNTGVTSHIPAQSILGILGGLVLRAAVPMVVNSLLGTEKSESSVNDR